LKLALKQVILVPLFSFKRTSDNFAIIFVLISAILSLLTVMSLLLNAFLSRLFINHGVFIVFDNLYRIPLTVLIGTLPTIIYVKKPLPAATVIEPTTRGVVHSILSIGLSLLMFGYFGWFYVFGTVVSFAMIVILYFTGRLIAFLILSSFSASLEKTLKLKSELAQKEIEQLSLQHYTDELERQHTAMRKFKHDYQNLLLPIHSLALEDDLVALKKYCLTVVSTASHSIASDAHALEGLSKIKVREVKSILAAKLMHAQNIGIATTFEANEIIDNIPVDSVTLVRKLGIILDNAIEALSGLAQGRLAVGCFKFNTSIAFIIKNTCPPDIPNLQKIWQLGFSTKGKNRGFGLSNLREFTQSTPNVSLDVGIESGDFFFKLIIHTDMQEI